jgi:predicted Rossmann-fold nucleotide-binding protein
MRTKLEKTKTDLPQIGQGEVSQAPAVEGKGTTKSTGHAPADATGGTTRHAGLEAKVELAKPGAFSSQIKLRALSPGEAKAYSLSPEVLVPLVEREILRAYEFAESLDPGVSVFGSARIEPSDPRFDQAKQWGEALLLANLHAFSPELGVKAIASGKFSENATQGVAAAILGVGVGAYGAEEVSKALAAIGGAHGPTAMQDALHLLQAQKLDDQVKDVLSAVVRSGAGPGIMDAVAQGYVEARRKLFGADDPRATDEVKASGDRGLLADVSDDLRKKALEHLETQGSRITLEFEQQTSPYIEVIEHFKHFAARRKALMLQVHAVVSEIGGLGTLNEAFEALRGGLPMVFDKGYYGEMMSTIVDKWAERGFSQDARDRIVLKEGVKEGFPAMVEIAAKTKGLRKPTPEEANQMAREFVHGILKLTSQDAAVTISGSSHLRSDDPAVKIVSWLASELTEDTVPVRIGAKGGSLHDEVKKAMKKTDPKARLQSVVLDEGQLGQKQAKLVSDAFAVVHSPDVHKVLLYENTDAFIFAPGGDGTFDEFFEILCLMQTKKIQARPLVVVGEDFWAPILDAIQAKMANTTPRTISEDDLRFVTVIKTGGAVTPEDENRPYRMTDEHGALEMIKAHRAGRSIPTEQA